MYIHRTERTVKQNQQEKIP